MFHQLTKSRRFQDKSIVGTKDGWGIITVKYGFDVDFATRSNQRPHFSITADVKTVRGRDVSGGQQHDLVARFFPSLRPLLKWHLTNADGLPMHYAANAAYHLAQQYDIHPLGRNDARASFGDYFRHTVVFGAVENDTETLTALLWKTAWADNAGFQSDFVRKLVYKEISIDVAWWCANRLEALTAAFKSDMRTFGLMD